MFQAAVRVGENLEVLRIISGVTGKKGLQGLSECYDFWLIDSLSVFTALDRL